MNACQTHVMLVPAVPTPKGLLTVIVIVGILGMASTVPVSKSFDMFCFKFSAFYEQFRVNFSFSFEDINECLSSPCDVNAICTNTEGSFVCECNSGYSGNGSNCGSKYFFNCISKGFYFSLSLLTLL